MNLDIFFPYTSLTTYGYPIILILLGGLRAGKISQIKSHLKNTY